jgi:hypothetical protein
VAPQRPGSPDLPRRRALGAGPRWPKPLVPFAGAFSPRPVCSRTSAAPATGVARVASVLRSPAGSSRLAAGPEPKLLAAGSCCSNAVGGWHGPLPVRARCRNTDRFPARTPPVPVPRLRCALPSRTEVRSGPDAVTAAPSGCAPIRAGLSPAPKRGFQTPGGSFRWSDLDAAPLPLSGRSPQTTGVRSPLPRTACLARPALPSHRSVAAWLAGSTRQPRDLDSPARSRRRAETRGCTVCDRRSRG